MGVYFTQFGRVMDCVVIKDRKSQRSRGFGFVQFDSFESAQRVMDSCQDHAVSGKKVEVKLAEPAPHVSRTHNEKNNNLTRYGYAGGEQGGQQQNNNSACGNQVGLLSPPVVQNWNPTVGQPVQMCRAHSAPINQMQQAVPNQNMHAFSRQSSANFQAPYVPQQQQQQPSTMNNSNVNGTANTNSANGHGTQLTAQQALPVGGNQEQIITINNDGEFCATPCEYRSPGVDRAFALAAARNSCTNQNQHPPPLARGPPVDLSHSMSFHSVSDNTSALAPSGNSFSNLQTTSVPPAQPPFVNTRMNSANMSFFSIPETPALALAGNSFTNQNQTVPPGNLFNTSHNQPTPAQNGTATSPPRANIVQGQVNAYSTPPQQSAVPWNGLTGTPLKKKI